MTARSASPPPDQPTSTEMPSTPNKDQSDTASTETTAANRQEESSKTANHVYIQHPEHSWIPAQVVERPNPSSAVVSIPIYAQQQAIVCDGGRTARKWDKQTIKLIDYPNHALPLQNVDGEGTLQVVEDMVDLPFLHEVSS